MANKKAYILPDKFPKLFNEWCLEDNGTTLDGYRTTSDFLAMWKCLKCGDKFQTKIKNRIKQKYDCKKCSPKGKS